MSDLVGVRQTAMSPDASESSIPLCRNCGASVADRYCGHCGQSAADAIVSLRRMATEFADDQLSLNSALPRTLGALLFRPGFLTQEYFAGRIVRYIRPFRLFLAASLTFFVALSFVASPDEIWRQAELRMGELPDVRQVDAEGVERWDNVNLQIDSTRVPGWLMPAVERLQARQDRLNSVPPREAVRAMIAATLEAAARMAFVLVPLFALLLAGLHFRQRRLYAEHFVFALHFHAAAFLLLTPAVLFLRSTAIWWIVGLWLLAYLFIALRRVYPQPDWLAALKFLTVLSVYSVMLSLAAGATSIMSLFMA